MGQSFATAEDLPALGLHRVDGGQHGVHGCGVHQRTHEVLVLPGIANGGLAVEPQQPILEGLEDGLADDHAAGGGAALAGGADGAEVDGAQGDVQVPLLAHDDGVVAAQLQDVPAEARLHQPAHVAAAGHGTRVGHQGHAGIGVDQVADLTALADG